MPPSQQVLIPNGKRITYPSANQNFPELGLPVNGEKDHGIEIKIITRTIENQIAMVLNCAWLVNLRFTLAEPMVRTTMAVTMVVLCSMPKQTNAPISCVRSTCFSARNRSYWPESPPISTMSSLRFSAVWSV